MTWTKWKNIKHITIASYVTKKHKKTGFIIVRDDKGFGKFDKQKKGDILKTPKCRFNFPKYPMRNTSFLEPFPSELNENNIQTEKNNLNKIKKFMLRKLFQEKKRRF